ncbi:SURF1 family protein [Pseudahrensia aquimaris]|uniref:SURF1-like protein n=1 Tax=Pseudahrensia aquimaris TaxID=744461 RepID=A0ABW3FGJ6_9HYPH
MKNKFSLAVLLICIASAFVVLMGLGFWQLQRLEWKEAMIARVEEGLNKPPLSIDEIEALDAAGEDIEYRPAFAEGTFLHDAEQHYFATYRSRVGYFVYTPLVMDDGKRLFVNRGFVPMERKDASSRPEGQIVGRVRIEGLARTAPTEKPNSQVPNNDLTKNVYYWKSLSQMAGRAYDKTEFDTASVFLDAGEGVAPGGLPIGGVTRITFSNNHLQYAYTWFGLAAALVGVGGFFLFSLVRGSKENEVA